MQISVCVVVLQSRAASQALSGSRAQPFIPPHGISIAIISHISCFVLGVLTLSFLVLFKQIANTINVLLSHGPSIIISSFFLFIFFPSFSHFVPPPLSLIPSVVQRLGKLAHVAFCLARSSRIWLHIDLTSNPADPDQVSL